LQVAEHWGHNSLTLISAARNFDEAARNEKSWGLLYSCHPLNKMKTIWGFILDSRVLNSVHFHYFKLG